MKKVLSTIIGVLFVAGVTGFCLMGSPGSQKSQDNFKKNLKATVTSGAQLAGEMVSPATAHANSGTTAPALGVQPPSVPATAPVEIIVMNDDAINALENATTDKLGFTEQAVLDHKFGPEISKVIQVGYGVDKKYFKPAILKHVGMPFVQQVADNTTVATAAFETAGKNQASTLTLAGIQLNKDERWTEEEVGVIAKIGYDLKNGIFLTKAAENEQQQIDEKAEELAEEYGKKFAAMTSKQKRTAGALYRLKKSMGGAHRVGNTWVLPLKADRVFNGDKTVVR
ncbi:MAG: hypothetical protein U9P50_02615 [Patescibacteria group bacterium]|nr:hypothetical protein [Patescibacteria group bacterium]